MFRFNFTIPVDLKNVFLKSDCQIKTISNLARRSDFNADKKKTSLNSVIYSEVKEKIKENREKKR